MSETNVIKKRTRKVIKRSGLWSYVQYKKIKQTLQTLTYSIIRKSTSEPG